MPAPFKQLSEEDKRLYMEIIKSGTEVRRYIRILILGKHPVGKSCLLRRLLGEDIEDVTSTDGIDIVVKRCKIRLMNNGDFQWIIDDSEDTDEEKKYLVRIKAAREGKANIPMVNRLVDESASEEYTDSEDESTPNELEETDNENSGNSLLTIPIVTDENEQLPVERDTHNQASTSSYIPQPDNTTPDIDEPIEKVSIKNTGQIILDDIHKIEVPKDKFVECGFWDFAGEKDYYATHQIFLHQYALYLLVADITDNMVQMNTDFKFDSIGEYIDFWLDNIHSYSDHDMEQTSGRLDPPVIVVGTGTDKCKDDTELKERKKAFKKAVYNKNKKSQHLRKICFVSNTKPDEEEFSHLRDQIFKYGRSLKTFSEKLPLRWIQLEKCFDERKKKRENVLPFSEVKRLSRDCGIDDTNEINLFLKYQHTVGSVIYFENMPDYVIINPKWLANAFRCLISNKFESELTLTPEWKTLEKNGKLEYSLVTELFKKAPELDFENYQDYILNIMEAFDMIFRPRVNEADGIKITSSFYMPCMIEESMQLSKVLEDFKVETKICFRTPWLCITFEFMPLSFFNHILVHLIERYTVCLKPSVEPAIYHFMAVFSIDKENRIKLFVCFCKNTVGIQLWKWGKTSKVHYNEILSDLIRLIENLKEKYGAKQIKYTIKAKCAEGKLENSKGQITYAELTEIGTDGNYMCEECGELHKTEQMYQTWFHDYQEKDILDPKKAFINNRVKIVQGLENPDDVACHLFESCLFTDTMRDVILQEKGREKKNSKILDTLKYRGKNAVRGLYEAFLETENRELAGLLAEYVEVIENDENRFYPSCWPPEYKDQKRMESESVRIIKDTKSPFVVQYYTDHANVYKMRNKTRGMVFMINNENFSKRACVHLPVRRNSDIDARNLRNLFNELQFNVVDKKDLRAQEMLNFIKEERDKVNWNDMECVILIIMSHGNTTGIFGINGVTVELTEFTNILKDCAGLNGKPKLVFVQACRGTMTETGYTHFDGIAATDYFAAYGGIKVSDCFENLVLTDKNSSDGVESESTENTTKTVHSGADFLIAYATPEGTSSYRNTEVGSWFLNAIVWTFKYHADHEDIQYLLTKVNQLVSMARSGRGQLTVSEVKHSLTKKFYFFPGIYGDPPKLLEE